MAALRSASVMGTWKRIAAAAPLVPLAGAAVVLGQVLRAAHRSDLPSFPNQEPSGTFGDEDAPPIRLAAVGDSSLTAPGVERLDDCWIRRVALAIAEDHRVELVSLGVGGSKARDVIEGQLHAAERLEPDVAFVSVGANDALRGVRVKRYREHLETILERLEAVSGAVVLVGMGDLSSAPRLPDSVRPWAHRRSIAFDDVCREVAARHDRVVKGHTRGRMTTAFFDDEAMFTGDRFHASGLGHAVFAEEIMPAVAEAMRIAGFDPGSLGGVDGDVARQRRDVQP